MSKIKYICLSDVHLGANTAILTDTPAVSITLPSGEKKEIAPAYHAKHLRAALARALVALLRDYAAGTPPGGPAGIVLLGDVLDFSLGTPKRAIDDFDRLLKALSAAEAKDVLGDFVFLPGNHDHALWTVARYQRMVGKTRRDDDFHHTTRAFDAPSAHPEAPIIASVLSENGFGHSATYYPNMGLIKGSRAVVLHHGHFIESTYRVMSNLVAQLANEDPQNFGAETLEILNASWIDFLWSSDGDDGKLGHDIQIAYEYLLTGAEGLKFDTRLADLIARKLIATLPLPKTAATRKLVDTVARAVVDGIVGQYGQTERFSYATTLGPDALAGLRSYITGPVLQQFHDENKDKNPKNPKKPKTPPDLTFIFGHTHKPFEDRMVSDGFQHPVNIYNTGGWDLDTPMFDTKLGAALVFIDDDLNVASLRICDVPRQDGPIPPATPDFKVHVATADGDIAGNPLAARLDRSLQACRQDWAKFAAEADKAYRAKQAFTMAQLHKTDRQSRKPGRVL